MLIGTNPRDADYDSDGMLDGMELQYGFDPFVRDFDHDGKNDYQEFLDGTDPYVYNKPWYEYCEEFVKGFILGDFIQAPDSLATVAGQITGNFVPGIDIRDVVADLYYGDYLFATLSFVGLASGAGDFIKAAGFGGKFIVKNADDAAKAAELMMFMSAKCPDAVPLLSHSDEATEAVKQISKMETPHITKAQRSAIIETVERVTLNNGVIKTSTHLDLKEAVTVGNNVWLEGWITRGRIFDRIINGHVSKVPLFGGESLGETFPFVDRIYRNEKKVISTKSLDLNAISYQDASKLQSRLNSYTRSLDRFCERLAKDGSIKRAGEEIFKEDCEKVVLEIIIPDTIISEDIFNELVRFQNDSKKYEIWYRIGY